MVSADSDVRVTQAAPAALSPLRLRYRSGCRGQRFVTCNMSHLQHIRIRTDPSDPQSEASLVRYRGTVKARSLPLAWLLLACPALAFAHGLAMEITVDGTLLLGTARYSDKSPVANEGVRIFSPPNAAEPAAKLVTGGDGRFAFEAKSAGEYKVVLDAGDGHVAERLVSVTAPVRAGAGGGITREELESAVAPLREDLAALRREWRLNDLLSAVGYLLGAFGLVAWLRSRKPR